jgi:hypothetical protein
VHKIQKLKRKKPRNGLDERGKFRKDFLFLQRINGARPHFVRKRTFSYRKWGLAPFSPSMSERSELRRRREEQMENGVKNLKGARLFPKTFPNHGFGDASSRV